MNLSNLFAYFIFSLLLEEKIIPVFTVILFHDVGQVEVQSTQEQSTMEITFH
jgi:hypothetical protein